MQGRCKVLYGSHNRADLMTHDEARELLAFVCRQ